MTITKCGKCGELMHKADRCFACGNTTDFTKVDSNLAIHENVKNEYDSLNNLVKNGKFEEALILSKLVLQWMPSCSDVFWLRLLAKNHCKTDEMLIHKGVSCEESADYYNAVLLADESQKKVYTNVADKITAVKKVLIQYITEHEYSKKGSTDILQVQLDFSAETEIRRKRLFQLWKKLSQVESQIEVIEKDCLLLIHEHKDALTKASSEAISIKAKSYKLEQCSAEDFHKYQIKFGNLLYRTEQAQMSIETMRKQHPWVEKYNALVKKRNDIISTIGGEIDLLKSYESRAQSTVSEIEKIEEAHTAALISISKYNFYEVRSLLGESKFMSAFVEAGLK